MNHLYAPWRVSYHQEKDKSVCPFCEISDDKKGSYDDARGVVYRSSDYFVVMNKFPYTPGHILIVPYGHISTLEELDDDIYLGMMKEPKIMAELLRIACHAGGINMGMNIGKAAGAGIEDHLHFHVMPRWIGDTNFATTVADVRVFADDKEEVFRKIRALRENV
jgi:diadenosine tetraphosphate (Ap4A) HIT family hydrolase